ncbi:MAG TPA: RpiB/LacA/LacB family sugar-phosphate isomerase [Prosthecobacter sp.]|nr:RpiB/LacA/LacB family sugar-phosphate isomerase [Prosthecobacter sp.]
MVQDPEDDYTTYAKAVAQAVLQNPAEFKGIVICGSGIGVSMMANRFKGIRAGLCQSPEAAKHGRANDDINVLALASSYNTTEEAEQIVDAFLNTSFTQKEKYLRRSRELDEAVAHGPSDTSTTLMDSP